MIPSTTQATFEHIGAVRLFQGSMRIDIKTMMAVIPASDVRRLMDHWPAKVYDISDVMKSAGEAAPVGQAWITRSGKAVMYEIGGSRYVSPLAQVRGMLNGARKYAGVSTMKEAQGSSLAISPEMAAAEVAA